MAGQKRPVATGKKTSAKHPPVPQSLASLSANKAAALGGSFQPLQSPFPPHPNHAQPALTAHVPSIIQHPLPPPKATRPSTGSSGNDPAAGRQPFFHAQSLALMSGGQTQGAAGGTSHGTRAHPGPGSRDVSPTPFSSPLNRLFPPPPRPLAQSHSTGISLPALSRLGN